MLKILLNYLLSFSRYGKFEVSGKSAYLYVKIRIVGFKTYIQKVYYSPWYN